MLYFINLHSKILSSDLFKVDLGEKCISGIFLKNPDDLKHLNKSW